MNKLNEFEKTLKNKHIIPDRDCIYGDSSVYENGVLYDDSTLFVNAQVYGNAKLYGSSSAQAYSYVYGNAKLFDDVTVYGNSLHAPIRIYGNSKIYSNSTITGYFNIFGNSIIKIDDIYTVLKNNSDKNCIIICGKARIGKGFNFFNYKYR